MLSSATTPGIARFGPYEIDVRTGEARKFGTRIKLGEQPLRILILLMQRRGELVTRKELCTHLWPEGSSADFDHSLNSAVQRLRVSLTDTAEKARWIETVPRRGYRFVGIVKWANACGTSCEPLVMEVPPAKVGEGTQPEPSPLLPVAIPQRSPWSWRIRLRIGGMAALLCHGLYVAGRHWWSGERHLPARAGSVMLAVLPFENLGGDRIDDNLSDGLTDGIIRQLAALNPEHVGVISSSTSMLYKHTSKSVHQIGNELNVDYVLESSIRRDADRLRITARLIRTNDQVHVWDSSYDHPIGASVEVQEEVAKAVAEQIAVKLSPQNAGLVNAGQPQ